MKTQTTIRWQGDGKQRRVAQLARRLNTSVNGLVNSLADAAIAQADAEASFRAAASRGNVRRALKLLDRLDAEDSKDPAA